MLKSIIYLVFCFIAFVHATYSSEDCDKDDLECLEDFITSTLTPSVITSSLSFYENPYSTIEANNMSDSSDFHEAGLSNKPKDGPAAVAAAAAASSPQATTGNVGSVEDSNDSGSSGLPEATDNTIGLNKIQTGVLSACGVLVVGGIAVGIFVWKSSNASNQDVVDLEKLDGMPLRINNLKKQEKQPMKEEKDIANYAMSNRFGKENFLKEPTVFSDRSRAIDKSLMLSNFSDTSFSTEFDSLDLGNPRQDTPRIPSALDPEHNRSTLNYQTRKFLKSPIVAKESPIKIFVNLEGRSDKHKSKK